MLRRFAKTALVGVLLIGASCSTFTWTGRGGGVATEASKRGVKDVATLERDYESQRFWARERMYMKGRWDAAIDGFGRLFESVDRHLLNYRRPGLRY